MRSSLRFAALGLTLALSLLSPLVGGIALASEAKTQRNAILVVAFGSSMREGQRAINAVVSSVKGAFPGTEVRLAYTSRIIMRKLAKEGQHFDDPLVALSKLHAEGFTHVAVLSTHVIPGEEYEDLSAIVGAFNYMRDHGSKSGFEAIALSRPLLWSPEDFDKMAAILNRAYGKDRTRAVVFMGHGSPHPAEGAYARLQTVSLRTNPNFVFGTVEGTPSLDDVVSTLKHGKFKRALLVPFMLVAGDHAHNDMAGPEDESWKSVLSKEGIRVDVHLAGLGENPEVRALLVEHLREAAKEAGF
ncbi:sirohydrochlorin cobaltochelatase [Thermanaerovibrio acidaminovorans]|uniref:sirohydrochlorin cobaltochelatase n=1 Tax=Thermanaerovibrio acidaminovorans TaxID=81462 RepID=UPI002490FA5B|nr:sirohydrochlorin cobaltochelatase [Thermanaerovibrio acidaminovorans]